LIKDLGPTKAYIIGSAAAVSTEVETALKNIVPTVSRLAGPTRFGTALKVYEQGIGNWGKAAIITNAANYADALSISPYAYVEKAPILLSDLQRGLDADTITAIKAGGFTDIIIVGSTAAVPAIVTEQLGSGFTYTRLGGEHRFETSVLIAEYAAAHSEALDYDGILVATGNNFPDALAGGAFAGSKGSVLLLTADSPTGRSVLSFVTTHKLDIGGGFFLGSSVVIPDALAASFAQAAAN
jgi:putative cell wall-binding protein